MTQVESALFTGPLGPNTTRQEAPHPHESFLDPTGQFILVPDLGADLVRVFLVDKKTLQWKAVAPLVAAAGSGPRHLTFATKGNKAYLYLISELANTITGYEVTYSPSSLAFKEVFKVPTHGEGTTVAASVSAAEIILSVSLGIQRFLLGPNLLNISLA
jgi:6-phosphogluconolactonase (cycloisomerase 2 family)